MSKKQNIFHRFVAYLDEKNHWYAATFFHGLFFNKKTILKGFVSMLRLAPGMLVGRFKKHFNYYGLNPKSITTKQAEHPPMLLIHGNYTNQSNWLHWAKKLRKDYPGPVFTVNLPSGHWSNVDRNRIDDKIAEIQSLYKERGINAVKTHLVGHSRGGALAYYSSLKQDQWHINDNEKNYANMHYAKDVKYFHEIQFRDDIDQVIILGSSSFKKGTFPQVSNKFHAVQSTNDFFLGRDTRTLQEVADNPDDLVVTSATHCSLIHDKNVYRQVLSWINNADSNKTIETSQNSSIIQKIK